MAGRLYALSTVGSILGTFLPVLCLIPAIGTRRTLLLRRACSRSPRALILPRRAAAGARRVLALLLPCRRDRSRPASDDQVLFEGESPYQFVQVRASSRTATACCTSTRAGRCTRSCPPTGPLTGGYWDAFLAAAAAERRAGRPPGDPRQRGRHRRQPVRRGVAARRRIDGVEIDPLVSDVGRDYLGMTQPEPDGAHRRRALLAVRRRRATSTPCSIDAYRQPYIPFHLVTREFFELVARPPEAGRRGGHQRRHPARADGGRRPHRRAPCAPSSRPCRSSRYDDFNSVADRLQRPRRRGARRRGRLALRRRPAGPPPRTTSARTLVDVPGRRRAC